MEYMYERWTIEVIPLTRSKIHKINHNMDKPFKHTNGCKWNVMFQNHKVSYQFIRTFFFFSPLITIFKKKVFSLDIEIVVVEKKTFYFVYQKPLIVCNCDPTHSLFRFTFFFLFFICHISTTQQIIVLLYLFRYKIIIVVWLII